MPKHLVRSTAADRAVDFARAVDHFERAASELRTALSLTAHHGARTSYGDAVAESIDLWATDARAQYETSLKRARGQHKEQVSRHAFSGSLAAEYCNTCNEPRGHVDHG